jgi:hypothetical protein
MGGTALFDATDDGITALSPILGRFAPIAEFIETDAAPEILPHLRRAKSAGQPLDSAPSSRPWRAKPSASSSKESVCRSR